MLDFSKLKDYTPLITTIIAGLLTYFLGFRKGKKDKFNTQIEESLSEILTPMLNAIKPIIREENAFQREKLLKNYFKKYSSEDTKLFKISSKFIHDWYYKTEELFYKFIKYRNQKDWEEFWVYFNKFHIMINDEYKAIRSVMYSDYKWLMNLNEKNYFLTIILESFVLIYEAIKFLIMMCFMTIIIFIIDNIQGKDLIPVYVKTWTFMILFVCSIFYGLLRVILSEYCSAKQMQRNNSITIIFRKKFPEFFKTWDKIIYIDVEKEKKNINIPNMCEKKNI